MASTDGIQDMLSLEKYENFICFLKKKKFKKNLHITAVYFKSSPGKAGVGSKQCAFDFFLLGLFPFRSSLFINGPFLSVNMMSS